MSGHRWSGWPGAWCLDCGVEDPMEVEVAGRGREVVLVPLECPEPHSHRFDPYVHCADCRRCRETGL